MIMQIDILINGSRKLLMSTPIAVTDPIPRVVKFLIFLYVERFMYSSRKRYFTICKVLFTFIKLTL